MNYFKTYILKKEFEEFKTTILIDVLKCDLRKKEKHENYRKFELDCRRCREACCILCKKFKSTVKTLMNNIDEDGKVYLENFIMDFLNIFSESLRYFLNVEKISNQTIARPVTFNVKSYHKSDKNRSQVFYKEFNECEKINFNSKNQKQTFYKKFELFVLELNKK